MDKPLALLNNLTPAQFLAEYWQKKPLFIRQAIPNFKSFVTPDNLIDLAMDDDVVARLITNKNGQWKVKSNPLNTRDFAKLPHTTSGKLFWTLLVQNVNHYLPESADLLALFNFIPHARLDDLMISYAPQGSGIGAHVDSYDVFLLQGAGTRKWQIASQTDLSLVQDAPLKILQNFVPQQEWILEAGDMLYLPPKIAHCGTSMSSDCMTYSIGFRAPKQQELAHEFLSYLQDNLDKKVHLNGFYTDADLTQQQHPAEITDAIQDKVMATLQNIVWDKNMIADFLGHFFTEPKSHVYFDAPKEISLAAFTKKLSKMPIKLHLKSQLLFTQKAFYMNGETLDVPANLTTCMRELADKRYLNTPELQTSLQANLIADLGEVLYACYLAGFIDF